MNDQPWTLSRLANNLPIVLLLFVILTFAPFTVKPHLYEKLHWAYYGGDGMRIIDFVDLAYHLLPTFLLLRIGILQIRKKINRG